MKIRKSNSRYTPSSSIMVEVIPTDYDNIGDEEIIKAVKLSKHNALAAIKGIKVLKGGGSAARRHISAAQFNTLTSLKT